MKKKIFKICASVVTLAGVFTLASCTGGNKPSSSVTSTPTTTAPTTTAPTTTAPTTTVPTTAPTTVPTSTVNVAEELLNRIILQGEGGAVSEDFTVPAELSKGEDKYQIKWTSNNGALVVAEEASNGTYKISVVRPTTDTQTVTLTAEIDGAKREFEFKVNPLEAIDFVSAFNFTYDKANVSGQFNLPTETTLDGATATIAWESLSDLITIEGNVAKAPYTYKKFEAKLKATFTYNNESKSKTFTLYVLDKTVYVESTEIKAETPYYISFVQTTLGGDYYWVTGAQSGSYGATSLAMTDGAKFLATAVDGGYTLSYTTAAGKTENLGVDDKGAKVYVKFAAETPAVWQWNSEYNTFTYTNSTDTFYMGTYSSYATLSMSKLSYASTSFVSHFYTEAEMFANTPEYTENDKVYGEYLSYSLDENVYAGETELLAKGKKFNDVVISYELKEAVDGVSIENGKLVVNVTEAKEVTLKVTFTLNETTQTKEVTFTARPAENQTIADFLAAKDTNKVVLLTGVVTAVNKVGEAGSFVLSDETGSVFCYTSVNVKLGDQIVVKAKYSENYTLPQIGSPVLVETKSENNNVVAASGTLTELTASDIAAALEGSTDASLTAAYSGKYLAIKGYAIKSGSYTNMAVAVDSTTAVVNLYANPDLNLASYQGKHVIVKGFVRGVKGGKNITIQIQSIEEVQLTPEEKVQAAMDSFTFADATPGTVTLPTASAAYQDVLLSFALKEGTTVASITEGVLTLNTVNENTPVTLIVTFTLGDIVQTKEVTFNILALEDKTIADFLATKDTTNPVKLTGIVTAVNKVGEAGSFVLSDASGSIFCYTDVLVTLGDEVVIQAVYSENKTVPQIGSPVLLETKSTGNDVVTASGTKESYTAAEVATEIEGKDNQALTDVFAGKYLEITGYAFKSGNYTNLAATADSTTSVVNLYANPDLNLASYAGKKIIVKGFVRGVNGSGKNITVQIQSIEEVQLTEAEKVQQELDLVTIANVKSEASVDLVANGSVYTDVAFTYALKDAAVTTVTIAEGKVTAAAVTEDTEVVIVVTATLGQTVQTKEVTIKVIAPLAVPTQDLALTFDDITKRTSVSATQQVWTENGITFTVNKGSGSDINASYSKPVRLYAKHEVIVGAETNIVKIVFNCNSASYATTLGNNIAGSVVDGKVVTVDLTAAPATSFTIASLTAQVRVDSIVVTTVVNSAE